MRAEMMCWACETKLGASKHWQNGLDLNLDCDAEERSGERTSAVPLADRQAWRALQQKWGSLSVLEEALVSRVSACTSVLKLPTDQQLGYTSSVINYINDTADISQKLPRAPKDSKIVVFQVPNAKGEATLQRVRKHAVREYLAFFAEHHPLYRDGIADPHDPDRFLVQPFVFARDFDHDLWVSWADEFVADLDSISPASSDSTDDPDAADDADGANGGEEPDADPAAKALKSREARLGIPTGVLLHWLQHGDDPAVRQLRAELGFLNLDPTSADDAERVLRMVSATDATAVRDDVLTVGHLAQYLHLNFGIGTVELNVPMINASLKQMVQTLYGPANTQQSGCPHDLLAKGEGEGDPAERRAAALKQQLGTAGAPFVQQLESGRVPISEFSTRGYETLAFPTLFPFGKGYFAERRDHDLSFSQYSRHLSYYYDGRFAQHGRFPYFLLNTHERQVANEQAGVAVTEAKDNATVGDVRNLSKESKKAVAKKISKFSSHLRNSPGFFDKRKKELLFMCDQLGDPHAFATNSHADTYCPYLARFVMTWAGVPTDGEKDPFAAGLSDHQRYQRRQALVREYPHLAAYFFHLKTELYLEHVCVGILGADAWWSRYEWQSRGSTHAHYFLWFRDAPDVSFLDDWLEQAMKSVLKDDEGKFDDEQMDALVDMLNARALAASRDSSDEQDREAAAAAEYWSQRCSRWNEAWLDEPNEPDAVGRPHPAEQLHVPATPADGATLPDPLTPTEHGIAHGAHRWAGRLLNAANRHTTHTSYCLRKDKHGKAFCRFDFPKEAHADNTHVHFYCEKVDGGVRWRLYFPMNDPLRNTVNRWQVLAQRSNVDFQPLIDHFAAVEYAAKYASKEEKGSASFDAVMAKVLDRSEEQLPSTDGMKRVYAAVLSQVVGGRNWSAQEVAHVNMGCPTVVSSHKFETIYLAGKRQRLRQDITAETSDDEPAFQPNFLDKYFARMDSCATSRGAHDVDQPTLIQQGFTGAVDPFAVDVEAVAQYSFVEFWRTHTTSSDGPQKRKFKVMRRVTPTVINVKPRLPRRMLKSADAAERQEYSRVQLLLHHPFVNRSDFDEFMHEHGGDYTAAYESWATSDPSVPPCVRDDFRHVNVQLDDGEPLDDDELPAGLERAAFDSEFSLYRYLGKNDLLDQVVQSLPLFSDWGPRTKQRYTAEQIKEADRWMQRAKAQPSAELPPAEVDVDTLNASQRFVFNVVSSHLEATARSAALDEPPPLPLHALICGTAGSGKTYLISALKQLLKDRCLVCAPTGVAADNIGGVTYHSKIPMPRDKRKLDVDDVRLPVDSTRLQQLESDFEQVRYLIIDEMSMVGRRSLGQIDHLLRQATGVETPFGGLSVLLVGDHGQLPPVKDHRAFDWDGVRHRAKRGNKKAGDKLDHAPFYQYHGTTVYEEFTHNVFFLDKVERIASSKDPAEAARLEQFRQLQLRARDGELTSADHAHFVEHMDVSKRHADFKADDVYRLVTTRKVRDAKNLEALEVQIRKGAPGISIPAVHSGPPAERAVDDDLGLARTLLLCLGARVMITKNISVAHGLCNGTMGTVQDVMCSDNGVVVAVLLRVRKRTLKQRGYAGPAFLDGALPDGDQPLEDDETIIALDRWTETIYEGGKSHTRAQFPIMLANCVTIHKAQGLTLDRVIIDAGADEKAMGQLFVALTRVRHPDHVAFEPVPSLDRVTTLIARKKSLYDRKMHECHLRARAAATAARFPMLQPSGFAVGAVPAPPPRYVAPDPSERQTGRQPTLDGATRQYAKEQQKQQVERAAQMANQQAVAEQQLGVNREHLRRLKLPPVHEASDCELPQWLVVAKPRLKLTARIVDYLPSNRAAQLSAYFTRLGFEAELDSSARQINNTCGVVAGRVAVDLQLAQFDEAGTWFRADTRRACDKQWYERANRLVGRAQNNTSTFYSGADVLTAAGDFWGDASTSDVMEWLPLPDNYDFVVRKIVDDLYAVARGDSDSIDLRIRISNTEDCRSTGMHWFTIAYAIQLVPGTDKAALTAAVRTAAENEVRLQTSAERRRVHEIFEEFLQPGAAAAKARSGTEEPHRDSEQLEQSGQSPAPSCPQCGSKDFSDTKGVDMLCNDCGYYCGLESDDEFDTQYELEREIEAELEADFEAEALLEAEGYQ